MVRILMGLTAVLAAGSSAAADAHSVRLHAAGSLRGAMTDIATAYADTYGVSVQTNFGASGAMRDRLANGEPGDVFASADMGSPLALTHAGKAGPVVLFARNHLCALGRPGLDVTTENILTKMIDSSIRVGRQKIMADHGFDAPLLPTM